MSPWKGLEAFLGSRRAAAGLTIIVVLIMVGLLAPVIAPHSPETIETDRILGAPNLSHPFGSDALGRDVLSRVLYSYRTSMGVAIGAVLLALLVGVPLGLLAGYFRSWTDTVLMRPLDCCCRCRPSCSPSPSSRSRARVTLGDAWPSDHLYPDRRAGGARFGVHGLN